MCLEAITCFPMRKEPLLLLLLILLLLETVLGASVILISPGPYRPGAEIEASWRLGELQDPAATLALKCQPNRFSQSILEHIDTQQSVRFLLPASFFIRSDFSCSLLINAANNIILASSEQFLVTRRPMYGQLIVLGYRDKSAGGTIRTDRNAKYSFFRKRKPNALMPDISRTRLLPRKPTPQDYSLSSVVVQADPRTFVEIPCRIDDTKDMLQVGRDPTGNDFTVPGENNRGSGAASRYGFRIVCDRSGVGKCQLFAAGYDHNQQIFLGDNALRFISAESLLNEDQQQLPEADGLITYGLMLWTPSDRRWREISVLGKAYKPRQSMTANVLHKVLGLIDDATNDLEDGSIIVNACNGFLWRQPTDNENTNSGSSSRSSNKNNINDNGWTPEAFNAYVDEIKSLICPVDFAPLEGLTVMSIVPAAPRPCVFPKCGHTFNQFPSTYRPSNCPTCRKEGPVTELKLRYEPRISRGPPTHVLTCGHGMSQECAQEAMERPMPRYDLDQTNDWKLPESSSKRACPFCGDLVTSQQTLYPLVELNRQ